MSSQRAAMQKNRDLKEQQRHDGEESAHAIVTNPAKRRYLLEVIQNIDFSYLRIAQNGSKYSFSDTALDPQIMVDFGWIGTRLMIDFQV